MSGDLSISASGCREQLRSANKAPLQLWNIHVWRYIVDYALKKYQMNQDVSDEQLDKARHDVEFLMTQFPELEALSRKIKKDQVKKKLLMWILTKWKLIDWLNSMVMYCLK